MYTVEWNRALVSDYHMSDSSGTNKIVCRDLRTCLSKMYSLVDANGVVDGVLSCWILHDGIIVEMYRSHDYPDEESG